MPSCSNMFKIIMYADDTTLLCDLNNDNDIETLINDELCKITNWLLANQLSLNVNKTKCMVFHSGRKHVVYPILSINGTVIKRVHTFNFLVFHISHDLKWKPTFKLCHRNCQRSLVFCIGIKKSIPHQY